MSSARTSPSCGAAIARHGRTFAAPDAVPTGLMPGEQIDHAGHRCGNPNFYVNTHPCLFPKRNVTP
ncbi:MULTISPECIES: hypothetical protein [unclassified Burkholderia]|uniref:hypothetical protein n=1 Tax=unclassified Burkholderia TaxID=2613784 RepID=UPI000F569FEE|nr:MULTISPECIES: hypothetical protein [unclassified Burkholderia]